MGAIWTSRAALITTLSETVGYKSGLALSHIQMQELAPAFSEIWRGDYSDTIRIRAEAFADLLAHLLYRVGNIPSPEIPVPSLAMYEKYKRDSHASELLEEIITRLNDFLADTGSSADRLGEPLDLDPFMQSVLDRYGPGLPVEIASDYISSLQYAAHVDPWSEIRRVEWADIANLANLFESESLSTRYGHFFDQRFVDFLAANFESIGRIHWRQFEGLTCEFFKREGFNVQIGPGRNDDNIDARIWPINEDPHSPPTILVQCKRQKDSVGKVVVKALWADIQAECATSGLIVTTSALSPGARATATARAYPILEANRATLANWIVSMRSPGSGVFLGE